MRQLQFRVVVRDVRTPDAVDVLATFKGKGDAWEYARDASNRPAWPATVEHVELLERGRVIVSFPIGAACLKCQDRPGKDGLGHPCKTCKGTGWLRRATVHA
jgi:DnaJ-class molecular chaperone